MLQNLYDHSIEIPKNSVNLIKGTADCGVSLKIIASPFICRPEHKFQFQFRQLRRDLPPSCEWLIVCGGVERVEFCDCPPRTIWTQIPKSARASTEESESYSALGAVRSSEDRRSMRNITINQSNRLYSHVFCTKNAENTVLKLVDLGQNCANSSNTMNQLFLFSNNWDPCICISK